MKDRVCLVTGVTAGIGKVTARELAKRGATVVLVARDAARGAAVLEEIQRETGNTKLTLLLCDLSSQKQIRRLASDYLARFDRLHVLINNAGAMFGDRRLTEDGIESTLATNHLAYFLLTTLLLDALKKGGADPGGARVVSVASEAHRGQSLDLDDLQFDKRAFVSLRVYGHSKLANVVWSAELARRLEGSGVTANSLHPGIIASSFGATTGPGWMRFGVKLVAPFLKSPDAGAETTLHLATSPELEKTTGKYFKDKREAAPSASASDPVLGKRLWEISEELTRDSA